MLVLFGFIAVLSLSAGLVVTARVQRASVAQGDGMVRMWFKGGISGGAAMMLVWIAFLAISNLVHLIG